MSAALARLAALLAKEARQLLRDPRMRFFLVVPPLFQLVVFGYAATFEVRHAEVGVLDLARSEGSRALVAALGAGGRFRLHVYRGRAEAAGALVRGEVRAVVVFPHDFARRPRVQVLADGSDSNSALLVLGQAGRLLRTAWAARAGEAPPLAVEERPWFNQALEDRWFFVPGVIANVVLITVLVLTAMAVVREREGGTLEQLLVAPVGRLELVLGKLLPVAAVGLADVALIVAVGVGLFGIPFRGEPLELLAGTLLFLLSAQGLGLLVSTWSATQRQALLLSFLVIMPLVVLSGFAFPIENMPGPAQALTWANPLRYYLVVVRGAFLKGTGLADHPFELGMMAALGAAAVAASLARLR